jgi:hypothetical protein
VARVAVRFWWPRSRAEIHGALWTIVSAALIVLAANLVLGVLSSYAARTDVLESREPVRSTDTTAVLVDMTDVDTGDGELIRYRVSGPDGDVVLPPGVRVWPGPGEVVLSSAARAARRNNPYIAALTPGRVVGRVSAVGLRDPGEMVAFVGIGAKAAREAGAVPTSRFGTSTESVEDLSGGQLTFLSAWSLLLVVFGAGSLAYVVALLTSPGRQRRLAVLMLLGTPSHVVRNIARSTMGIMAAVGVGVGVGVALAAPVARAATHVEFFGVSRWPGDAIARPGSLALVGLVTVGAMAWLAGRAVDDDPWSVRRRASDTRASLFRLVPLAVGLVTVAAILRAQGRYAHTDTATPVNTVLLLFAAIIVTLVGLVLAGPLFVRAASVVASRGGLTWRLAGARAAHHSRTTGRLGAALVTLMIATGVASGVLAATVGQSDLRHDTGRVLSLPGPPDADPKLIASAISAAFDSGEVVKASAIRSDGTTDRLESVRGMRDDDIEYAFGVRPDEAPRVAAAMVTVWPDAPARFQDSHPAGDRNARLTGAATLTSLAICVLLLTLATCLSMLALQDQRSDADQALLASGLSAGRLARVRGAEVLLTTSPAPIIAGGIGMAIAVAVMHVDHTSTRPEYGLLSMLLVVPVAIAVVLAVAAAVAAPDGRSIQLRRD